MSRLNLAPLLAHFGERAKALGAIHRSGQVCRSTEILPPAGPVVEGGNPPAPGLRAAYTTGCGGESLMELPFPGSRRPERGGAVVCAVDDCAYAYPKYA